VIETTSLIIGVVTACGGIAAAGYAFAQSRNGYVKREDCHKHVDDVKEEISGIHKRVDETQTIVSDMRQQLGEVHGWVKAQQ
jgi:hypothetical protein